ncbi:uncharacterized protein CANTADRAFT_89428 [Suhomyces tanzawaensis NRRL Y-17324]|uniref:SGT1-domain-containing protein n=1 Tax=Suhomyces tanzawaensis NRRL Y-17324 TaxID=984487 RepID=A0A1E4SJY2_9ASCO|nr:uncharacterized protein CANTADRAFT_89428 [Suhomyces tanzawaensis NRRL Y-17324]ODV79800.1 hypothetical protein CANTADRAFT_89428 [Suhomyces tanzawaensis NRRL Y-17324]
MTLDDSYVWETSPPNPITVSQRFSKLTASFLVIGSLLEEVSHHLDPFIKHYPWSINRPYYDSSTRNIKGTVVPYVYGELEHEDMFEDEQLLVSLLMELSQKGCFVHVWNSEEYEPLLVYAVNAVAEWEGIISLNRVWLNNGKIATLNTHGAYSSDTKDANKFLPMDRAVAQVLNGDHTVDESLSKEVVTSLNPFLSSYKLENVYDFTLQLPGKIATAFTSDPWLIGKALSAWKPKESSSMKAEQGSDHATVTISLNLSSLLHLSLITEGRLELELISEELVRGYGELGQSVEHSSTSQEHNSRDVLQSILLEQNRINIPIAPDYQTFREMVEQMDFDEQDIQKRSEEDAGRLQEHFESYLEKENQKVKDSHNADEEEEEDSSDDSSILRDFENNPELLDFINYCYEDKHKKTRVYDYNDDSDYQSDGSIFEINHDSEDDGDRIIDVDDEEDALVQDDEQEEKIGERFEQELSDDETEEIHYGMGKVQL